MLWKCYTKYARKFGKFSSGHRTGKDPVFILIPKKHKTKECSNYHKIELISYASRILLKILQARLQWYVNWQIPYVQAGFRKGRGTRGKIANIHWNIEKTRQFQKNIYFSFIDYAITTNCGKFLERWEYQTVLLASWKACIQVKKQQLELDMKQWTGSKLGKEDIKII